MHAWLADMPVWKHPFAKVGDHLERHRPRRASAFVASVPPSDSSDVRRRTKADLLTTARRLGLRGRSRMTKAELARAIARAR